MAHAATLSTMTGLMIAGAGFGLYLGNSAIGQIDPVQFGGIDDGSSFYADRVANRPGWDGEAPATLRPAEYAGLGNGCVGCIDYPEEYYPQHDPAIDAVYATETAFTPDPETVAAEEEVAALQRRDDLARVERYSHFPVSQNERSATVQAAATPAPVPPGQDCAIADQCAGDPTPGI